MIPMSTLYRSEHYESPTGEMYYSFEHYPFTNYSPRQPRFVSQKIVKVKSIKDLSKWTN